jgi:hypothetical protein
MKFLMISKSIPGAPPPSPAQLAELGRFTEEMIKSGVVTLTGGMVRPTTGIQLQNKGGKVVVTDGPFAETKELIDGFAIVEAKSREEAIQHATAFMKIVGDGSQGEILALFEPGPPPAR